MNYTNEELKLMDLILDYTNINEWSMPSGETLKKVTAIDEKENEYLFKQVCIEGKKIGLFNIEVSGYGHHRIVRFNKYEIERFLKHGGFEKHLHQEEIKITPIINQTNNYGTIGNLNQGERIFNTVNGKLEEKDKWYVKVLKYLNKHIVEAIIIPLILAVLTIIVLRYLHLND